MYTIYKWSQKFKCKILYYVCFSGKLYKGMQEADEGTNMNLGRVVAISASMPSPEGVGIFPPLFFDIWMPINGGTVELLLLYSLSFPLLIAQLTTKNVP